MWEELNGAGNALSTCLGNIYFVVSVMLWDMSDVPAVDAMWIPCAPDVGRFIGNHIGTGRGDGSSTVVEGTVKLSFGRDTGVDGGRVY